MAAFCPSERIRFSNAGNRFAVAAADGAPGAASRATGFAELPAAAPPSLAGDALRASWAALTEEAVSCSRSCCSATSLRNSPSGVNSRRSTTLKVSSCLGFAHVPAWWLGCAHHRRRALQTRPSVTGSRVKGGIACLALLLLL